MGFFKNLGKSIKGVVKMVSIKNLVKVAKRDVSGLGKELANRVAKPHIKPGSQFDADGVAVDMLEQVLQDGAQNVNKQIVQQAAKNGVVQDIAGLGSQIYLKTMWTKYKWWIIGVGVAVVTLVGFLIFRKKGSATKRYA